MSKYVNKGDARFPRTDYVHPEFRADPSLLQSLVAQGANKVAEAVKFEQYFISLLEDPGVDEQMKPDVRVQLRLVREQLRTMAESQVQLKHKLKVIFNERRASKPAV